MLNEYINISQQIILNIYIDIPLEKNVYTTNHGSILWSSWPFKWTNVSFD
jgi:hypothetical protein